MVTTKQDEQRLEYNDVVEIQRGKYAGCIAYVDDFDAAGNPIVVILRGRPSGHIPTVRRSSCRKLTEWEIGDLELSPTAATDAMLTEAEHKSLKDIEFASRGTGSLMSRALADGASKLDLNALILAARRGGKQ